MWKLTKKYIKALPVRSWDRILTLQSCVLSTQCMRAKCTQEVQVTVVWGGASSTYYQTNKLLRELLAVCLSSVPSSSRCTRTDYTNPDSSYEELLIVLYRGCSSEYASFFCQTRLVHIILSACHLTNHYPRVIPPLALPMSTNLTETCFLVVQVSCPLSCWRL